MHALFQTALALTTGAVCLYGMSTFGASLWPALFLGLSIFLIVALIVPKLTVAGLLIGRGMSIASGIDFVLLMIAGTIGGSFNLSESNKVVALALGLMTLFGGALFLIPTNQEH